MKKIPRTLIIASKFRENNLLLKATRHILEIAEATRHYNYNLINKNNIPIRSDIFVLESDVSHIPKNILEELEELGIIKRNPLYPFIIEVMNIDEIIEAATLSKNMTSLPKEINKMVNEKLEDVKIRPHNSLDLIEKLLPYTAPHVENVKDIEQVKKGVILQMFSARDMPRINLRNRIHILMVGDPGTGKSLLLSWVVNASGGIYRSLKVTQAGLTGSLRWEHFIKNEPLLKKADGKILALDEIDKISKEDLDPLLTAMEEGKVTMSGAELDVKYNARVRVIAAANSIRKFRREFLDRFDLRRMLTRPNYKEISQIIDRVVTYASEDEEGRTIIMSRKLFRRLLEKRRNFQPKIIDKVGVKEEMDKIISKEGGDTVRQIQKWLRFSFAFARLHGVNVNGEVVKKTYETLSKKVTPVIDLY
jgi:DNA replicative helicase MCM subunit Mcm2 (Cdc46/Mcm family)